MMPTETARTVTWPLALAAAAILGSLATACMMPFVAVATLAAATMPRGSALVTVMGAWAANQLLGFGLLGYPWTDYAMVWGLALGAASVTAMLIARAVAGGTRGAARIALAFVAAFAGYEALLFGFALVAGGTGTFTAAIVGRLLVNEAGWLVGLGALYVVLARAVPGWIEATPAQQRG